MRNQILNILKTVKYPGFDKDIITFKFLKKLQIQENSIHISLSISSHDTQVKQQLNDDIRAKLKQFKQELTLDIQTPQANKTWHDPNAQQVKSHNMAPGIKDFIMISSGKGGVGKSTTTSNLAIASAMLGKKVGILDADIYGPNIPRMLGIQDQKPQLTANKASPILAHGVEVMSMALLMEKQQSLIWRGPMIMKAMTQFMQDILWDDLDLLFIDMPPGTGDAQLSLAQSVPVSCGVMVSTAQTVALDDAYRSIDMFHKLNIPLVGIVENMSSFQCPGCDEIYDLFGQDNCQKIADHFQTSILAQIPIDIKLRQFCDAGQPIVITEPNYYISKLYFKVAENIINFLNTNKKNDNAVIQPTIKDKPACSS